MKTRSQSVQQINNVQKINDVQQINNVQKINERQEYNVNINFDEASDAWRQNKKSIGNGSYKYICISKKKEIQCGKSCYKNLTYCWQHRNYKK
jgi:hypothetical protein